MFNKINNLHISQVFYLKTLSSPNLSEVQNDPFCLSK